MIHSADYFCFSQELALKMSEAATKELVNSLNDPEEPFTPEVEEAAVGVTGCLLYTSPSPRDA